MKILHLGFLGMLFATPLLADYECGCYTQSNPLLYQREDEAFTLQFTGEFLYMKSYTPSLNYLVDGVGISNAAGAPEINVPSQGIIYAPDFKYQPGFRVSAAAYFGINNDYDITARYWRLRTNASGHFSASDNPELNSTVQLIGGFLIERNSGRLSYQAASIDLDLPENILDLMGGYSIDVTKNLYFRPFAGLSGFWTKPILNVEYNFTNLAATSPAGDEISQLHAVSSGWGIGPILGLDGSWSLNRNLSLFASFDFTTRYSAWKMRCIEQETRLTAPGGTFDIVRGKANSQQVGVSRSFLIGPKFDFWFFKDSCHLTLKGAWQWIALDGTHQVLLDANVSDVNFRNDIQGLNASASLEF